MYFLTICAAELAIVERAPYSDYSEAINACGEYYEVRFPGSVLEFCSVVSGKRFMRSHASLTRVEDLGDDVDRSSGRGLRAVKDSNAFIYAKSYAFLIESDLGVQEADRCRDLDAKDEAEDAGRLH